MKTPALQTVAPTGAIASAITRCMDAYHPHPRLKAYTVQLLIDGHILETVEARAFSGTAAFDRAIDLRRSIAIREGRPELRIEPWSITETRLSTQIPA